MQEIGNREWVWTREPLHAGRVGHLLIGDNAGRRRPYTDNHKVG